MKKEFNRAKLENLVTSFLKEVGDNPKRKGLVETPKRAAKAICELLEGMRYSNDEIAEKYDKCFEEVDGGNMVLVKDIPFLVFANIILCLCTICTPILHIFRRKKLSDCLKFLAL